MPLNARQKKLVNDYHLGLEHLDFGKLLSDLIDFAVQGVVTVGAEASNAIDVTLQVNDLQGLPVTRKVPVDFWLSSAAAGVAGTATSGGLAVQTNGVIVKERTTDVEGNALTDANGVLKIRVTDSGTTTLYLNFRVGNSVVTGAMPFA